MSDYPWLKRCLILLLDKLNCATDLSMLLCLGCRLEVDKNHRSLPCPFKIQPPVKHCSAIGIMNHPNHSWSGLLVAISSCHGFVPPRLRVEFIYFFLWVNPPACGTIPETSAFAFLAFFTRTSMKAGGEDMKKIPFIPGVKMHSVDIALSPKNHGLIVRWEVVPCLFLFKMVSIDFYDSCAWCNWNRGTFFQLCWERKTSSVLQT